LIFHYIKLRKPGARQACSYEYMDVHTVLTDNSEDKECENLGDNMELLHLRTALINSISWWSWLYESFVT